MVTRIKDIEKGTALHYFLIYSILFAMIAGIGFGMLPFYGKSLIWQVDGIGQFYPAFRYIGNYIGKFAAAITTGCLHFPKYDLSIGMGESIIGVLNYYGFGDPINLLAGFANDSNGTAIFAATYIIRLYLAGMTFMFYCKKVRIGYEASYIGALCYVFSGFAIAGGLMYVTWMSVLVYFPLLLAGVEDIIENRKKVLLLILSVCYAALCGFYYLYMCSLVLILYCIVRFVSYNGFAAIARELKGGKKCLFILKNSLSGCIYCVAFYLVGLIIASPVFFYSVRGFFGSERSVNIADTLFDIHRYVPRISQLSQTLKNAIIPSRYNLVMGAFLVEWIAVILLFAIKRGYRYLMLKIAVIVSIAAMSVSVTGYLFNAFSETNDRWIFTVHFLLAVIVSQTVEDIKNKSRSSSFSSKRVAIIGIAILTCANIVVNFVILFGNKTVNWSEEFVTREEAALYTDSPCAHFATLKADKGLYRVATTLFTDVNGRPENLAMLNDYYGMTYWYSIINMNVQKDVDEYNNETMYWRSYGFNDDVNALNVMGVKYLATDNPLSDAQKEQFEMKETITFNNSNWSLYENRGYRGAAFIMPKNTSLEGDFAERMETMSDCLISGAASVLDVTYDNYNNILHVSIDTDSEGTLVTALPYERGWKAYIDGREVAICKIDMFLGIDVGSGDKEVILQY